MLYSGWNIADGGIGPCWCWQGNPRFRRLQFNESEDAAWKFHYTKEDFTITGVCLRCDVLVYILVLCCAQMRRIKRDEETVILKFPCFCSFYFFIKIKNCFLFFLRRKIKFQFNKKFSLSIFFDFFFSNDGATYATIHNAYLTGEKCVCESSWE